MSERSTLPDAVETILLDLEERVDSIRNLQPSERYELLQALKTAAQAVKPVSTSGDQVEGKATADETLTADKRVKVEGLTAGETALPDASPPERIYLPLPYASVCSTVNRPDLPQQEYVRADIAARSPLAAEQAEMPSAETFQARVDPWLLACFGEQIARDKEERNHRFLEEALELVQACGCGQSEAHQLVDYTFNRPSGDASQEVGGVMVTLAALCLANCLDMHEAGETELARIWTKVETIRAKQAAKPKHSPLPAARSEGLRANRAVEVVKEKRDEWRRYKNR